MGRLFAVEIVYRGIFQKTLAKHISRAIVLAAHREGKPGISFGRYGDSPERNGIPAKSFAIVATDDITLEEGMAKYEPKEVDVSICLDDTLCKGVESWAWYGLQPINKLLKPGGTLMVTSRAEPERLIAIPSQRGAVQAGHRQGYPQLLRAMGLPGRPHRRARAGGPRQGAPEIVCLDSLKEMILERWRSAQGHVRAAFL